MERATEPKNEQKSDYRQGLIVVNAVGDKYDKRIIETQNDGEGAIMMFLHSPRRSPLLVRMFEKALALKGGLSIKHRRRKKGVSVAVFVDQKEFSTIIDIIGTIYLGIHNEGEIRSKIVLYKKHAYKIYVYKGELDMPDTLERDRRRGRKIMERWIKKQKKIYS